MPYVYCQPQNGYRLNTDTLLLTSLISAQPGENILDVGCGVGGIGLSLMKRCPNICFFGLDYLSLPIHLAYHNFLYNFFPSLHLIKSKENTSRKNIKLPTKPSFFFCHQDMRSPLFLEHFLHNTDFYTQLYALNQNHDPLSFFHTHDPSHNNEKIPSFHHNSLQSKKVFEKNHPLALTSTHKPLVNFFDHVVTNPPFYHKKSFLPAKNFLKRSSFMIDFSLDEWMDRCWQWVKPKGNLYFILPSQQLAQLNFLKDKKDTSTIIPIFSKKDKPPKRFLVRIHKSMESPPLSWENPIPPLTLYEEDGSLTRKAKDILERGSFLEDFSQSQGKKTSS